MISKMREGFPAEAYSQHPTKTFLTTLKAMYVTERLNSVFGIGRWTIHVEVIERTENYVLMQGEFESLDYDVIVPKQFGGHPTDGKNTEIADGFKSALTDCQSKIASYFEIGIDMFKGKINPVRTKPVPYEKPNAPAPVKSMPEPKEPIQEMKKILPVLTEKQATELALRIQSQDAPDVDKWIKYLTRYADGEYKTALINSLNAEK